jgi:hypothetical protein
MKRLPPAVLVETYIISGPGGRTMSYGGPKMSYKGAGLHDNRSGDWLWVWGTGEWNRYELWQFR